MASQIMFSKIEILFFSMILIYVITTIHSMCAYFCAELRNLELGPSSLRGQGGRVILVLMK